MRLKLSGAMSLFGAALAVGLVLLTAGSWNAIANQRVGGPLYREIVAGKDLTADILPPPMYVIEAYLDAQTAYFTRTPDSARWAAGELKRLRGEYETRTAYWRTTDVDPQVKQILLEDTDAHAKQMLAAADRLVAGS